GKNLGTRLLIGRGSDTDASPECPQIFSDSSCATVFSIFVCRGESMGWGEFGVKGGDGDADTRARW
ncbi:MAG TPA: hypothetical protein VH640_09000, partial [Bryobacteraceae bacterium]